MPKKYKQIQGLTYRAERALRKCINGKWTDLSSGEFKGSEEPECALCKEFVTRPSYPIEKNCLDCPIYHRTGQELCYGTPYRNWCMERCISYLSNNAPAVIEAAKKERKFLMDTLRLGLNARERARRGK